MARRISTQTLDQYLRPHVVLTGKVICRDVVETIRDWASGNIEWNKASDKRTLSEADKALNTGAKWFAATFKKNSNTAITKLVPITSISQAKQLGLNPYVVPGFPKGYKPGDMVGCQHFTYGQLYAAWRSEFEKMLSDTSDTYPLVTDLRGHPDYNAWENVDCGSDDVEALFQRTAKLTKEVDAMCVDFYDNDPWDNHADPSDFGFHIQDGYINKDNIDEKFLPEGSDPAAAVKPRNKIIESADTKNQVENYFRGLRRKVPSIIHRLEGFGSEGLGTTLVFRPKGHPNTLRLRLKENMKWQCDCIDPKDPAMVYDEGSECDTIDEAISKAVDCYEEDIPLDIPGFTKENISKAKKLAKELTQHLKDCGLQLAMDDDEDILFIVPKGTRWGSDKPSKGYIAANGNVLEEMEEKGTLFTPRNLVHIHMCDACEDFSGELHYPDPRKSK